MRRFLNDCGHHRARLCHLAGGALPDQERASVENHLTTCAGCRKYYDEIKSLTVPLANWEKSLSHIEPATALKARWEKDFQEATRPVHPARFALLISILDWCHDMIWPCRRIWTGFAAIWLAIFAINFSTRDTSQTLVMKSSRPSLEMVRACLDSEGFLADWTKPGKSRVAPPPKQALPTPRSQQRLRIFRA